MQTCQFFDLIAEKYDQHMRISDYQAPRVYGAEIERALKMYNISGSLQVCDLGTGIGHIARAVRNAASVSTIHGVDVSGGMLRIAQRSQDYDGLVQARIQDGLPLKSQSYDLVTMCNTLQYISDPAKAIQDAVRIVRQGGVLIFDYLPPNGVTDEMMHCWQHGHDAQPRGFSMAHIIKLVSDFFDADNKTDPMDKSGKHKVRLERHTQTDEYIRKILERLNVHDRRSFQYHAYKRTTREQDTVLLRHGIVCRMPIERDSER